MTERDAELFNDSLERCTARPGFFDRFYERFLASSEEVREKFKHTDWRKQKRALRTSLFMMMERNPEGDVHVERMARLHSRGERDIRPHLYGLWLDCLVDTAREFDPLFNADTEQAWRQVLRPGIEFMKARY
jgi:hemoglobin-like flavoprotein